MAQLPRSRRLAEIAFGHDTLITLFTEIGDTAQDAKARVVGQGVEEDQKLSAAQVGCVDRRAFGKHAPKNTKRSRPRWYLPK